MNRNSVFVMLAILLVGAFTFSANVQRAMANGPIYIRADGSIDPSTANISTTDNVTYTFTSDIFDSIIVERDNIVVDGAGHTIQGGVAGKGITLEDRSNVTIENMVITSFDYGIYLQSSSGNILSGNNVTNNNHGVWLTSSSRNVLSGNNMIDNVFGCIRLWSSSNNTLSDNNVANNRDYDSIGLYYSSNNTLSNNTLSNNTWGISLWDSRDCKLQNNTMTDNTYGLYVNGESISDFDNQIDESNIIDGKATYYLMNRSDMAINSSAYPSLGFLALVNSTDIIVEDLNISARFCGVLLVNTNNSLLRNVRAENDYGGIAVCWSNNVTIDECSIFNNTDAAVYVLNSDNCSITSNTAASQRGGIEFKYSSNNIVTANCISNNEYGLYLNNSESNTFYDNNVTSSGSIGIFIASSSGNVFSSNSVANNYEGIVLLSSSNNTFFHNNLVNNTYGAYASESANSWDDGYPSGGNYWADYNGTDVYSGPYQNETGSDWIEDTPYVVDQNNVDSYPLTQPFAPETEEVYVAYRSLLVEYDGLNASCSQISSNYGKLRANLEILNETLQTQIRDYLELQTNYTVLVTSNQVLQQVINSLNISYENLASNYTNLQSLYSQAISATNELQGAYDTLNTSYTQLKSKQESTQNTLNNLQNTAYVITAMLAILIIAVVYLAVRKPRTKP
jgi:parallel beta-helix repeat protein